MRDFVLNEEQKRLAEENVRLASHFFNRYRPPVGFSKEDWYQEVMYVLCRTAYLWKPSKGAFATLFGHLVRWQWMDCRVRVRKEKLSPYNKDAGPIRNSPVMLKGIIGSMPSERIDVLDEFEDHMEKLPEEWRDVCMQAVTGKGFTEESAKELTKIRNFILCDKSRVGRCISCGDVFIAKQFGPIRHCDSCKILVEESAAKRHYANNRLSKQSKSAMLSSSRQETA